MATAAYKDLALALKPSDLFLQAELVREATETPGWKFVLASIDHHRERLTTRLVHQSTKPEAVDYLRGQIEALQSMREAAEAIMRLAEEREAEARQQAQEHAHV